MVRSSLKSFSLTFPHLKKHRPGIVAYLSLSIMAGLLVMVTPYLIGDFIDTLIVGGSMAAVARFCLLFAGINIGRLAFGYAIMIIHTKVQTQAGHEFGQDAISRVHGISLSFVNKRDTDYITQVVNGDTQQLTGFCVNVLSGFVLNSLSIVIPLSILFTLNPLITVIMAGFLLFYVLIYMCFKKPLFGRSMALRSAQNTYFSKLLEQLKLTKFIKIHALQGLFRMRVDTGFGVLFKNTLRYQKLNYAYSSMDNILTTVVQVTLFLLGGYFILTGGFTIGMFTVFSMYFTMILGASKYFFNFGKTYQDSLVSHERLMDIYGKAVETNGETKLMGIEKIEARNLGFTYSESDKEALIENLNVVFTKGSIYAIAGKNGAGKSTFISLIFGMYADEVAGDLLFNGVSIKEIDMDWLRRRHMGMAEQEPVILSDEGYMYNANLSASESGDEPHDEREIKLAGYFRLLSLEEAESGNPIAEYTHTNLSGGERQKLAIVRVLLKNPDVMVFDEPTSAMDSPSAAAFAAYLHGIKKDKIVLVVTHDKELMKEFDEIIEF